MSHPRLTRAGITEGRIASNSYGGDEYNGVIAAGRQYYSHPGVAMMVSTGGRRLHHRLVPGLVEQVRRGRRDERGQDRDRLGAERVAGVGQRMLRLDRHAVLAEGPETV